MTIPYPVTLYGCQFKCGHRHVKNERLMIAHEARCWRNPANRTCKTCLYESYYTDTSGWSECGGAMVYEPEWYERVCSRTDGLADSRVDAIYDALHQKYPDNEHLYGIQIPPVTNCPHWEPAYSPAPALVDGGETEEQ